ncbi:MAG: hypothetical protein BWK79_03785 [Beggiatoa sp. IS2]|nr:MAG: hypothetical protein BWK79_03785 [Beggiatoa sp. IS2]
MKIVIADSPLGKYFKEAKPNKSKVQSGNKKSILYFNRLIFLKHQVHINLAKDCHTELTLI